MNTQMLPPSMPEMFAPMPDIRKALARIKLDPDGDYSPSLENLRLIMRAHIRAVPYENLDIYDFRRRIDISLPALYEKFVNFRRGGYCYEINGFFMGLLQALGYDCTPLSGRLLLSRTAAAMPAMSHRTTIVKIDGTDYLCDVGYGAGCAEGPVRVDTDEVQEIEGSYFSIRHHEGGYWGDITLVKHADEGPFDFYTVYLRPHTLLEFVSANFYTSESPDSGFKKRRVVRLRTDSGSIVVDNTTFRRKVNGEVFEEPITSFRQLYGILTTEFNMIVPKISYSPDFPKEWFPTGDDGLIIG